MKKRLSSALSAFLIVGITLGMSHMHRVTATTITGTNTLLSYNALNTGPSSGASWPATAAIADDDSTVVWFSNASDVVSGVSGGGCNNLYMRNLKTSTNSLVNVDLSGSPSCVESSGGNGGDYGMSSNGRYVAYVSKSTNVVTSPTVPTDNLGNVYLKDTLLGVTTLVNTTPTGALANNGGGTSTPIITGVSDDGRLVVFRSESTNLLSSNNPSNPNYTDYPYIKDMLTGQTINPVSPDGITRANSTPGVVSMSCNGSELVYSSNATNLTPQDNGNTNVYLLDLRNGYHVSNLTYAANSGSGMGNGSISCNGRYVLMNSTATNLTSDSVSGSIYHVFRYDRFINTYSLVDKSTSGYIPSTLTATTNANGTAFSADRAVSDNGLVVFRDSDHNLVSPAASKNSEIYLRDPDAGTSTLVPINSSGVEQNATGVSGVLGITADGKSIIYDSASTNLVPGVTSGNYLVLSKIQ